MVPYMTSRQGRATFPFPVESLRHLVHNSAVESARHLVHNPAVSHHHKYGALVKGAGGSGWLDLDVVHRPADGTTSGRRGGNIVLTEFVLSA